MQCPDGGCDKCQYGSGSNPNRWTRYEPSRQHRQDDSFMVQVSLAAELTSRPHPRSWQISGKQLIYARQLFGTVDSNAPLPIGVGCLTMKSHAWKDNFVQLVGEHRPVAVWLFAYTHRSQHTELIQALQTIGRDWGLKVIVQVGTVESAKEAIEDGADILSVQGSDAGGHQDSSIQYMTISVSVLSYSDHERLI